MDKWQSPIEEAIQKAMEAGKFDNLPGKGQRLDLGPGQGDDPEWAARRLLQNNGFVPDWISERKALLAEIGQARGTLARSWQWRVDALANGEGYALVATHWDRAVARFRAAAEDLNPRIRTYNLKAQLANMQVSLIDVEWEIQQVQQGD